MFGLVLFLHPETLGLRLEPFFETIGLWAIAPGVVVTMMTMMGWWRDVIDEATVQKLHTSFVQLGLRYGMALFIASEVMFFAVFFWAFFDASLFPKEAAGFVWPPEGIEIFEPFDLPLLNTVILLTSGITVTWAHHDIREGNMAHAARMLGRYGRVGISVHAVPGLGICPRTFRALPMASIHRPSSWRTGFHGFHVIVGTLFLAVNWVRCAKGHFEPKHHFGFEAAAWYWHFVDVVWLFLFSFVYVWSAL